MLLRASGEAIGEQVHLEGSVGEGDGGVASGTELLRFAEAATRGNDDLVAARRALIDAVGGSAFVEAAATVAIFNGLVRVADSTGIPLDRGTQSNSSSFRESLGLNEFGGARNTKPAAEGPAAEAGAGVLELFGPGE